MLVLGSSIFAALLIVFAVRGQRMAGRHRGDPADSATAAILYVAGMPDASVDAGCAVSHSVDGGSVGH